MIELIFFYTINFPNFRSAAPDTLDGILMGDENFIPRKSRPRERKPGGLPTGLQSRERLYDGDENKSAAHAAEETQQLLQKLRQL